MGQPYRFVHGRCCLRVPQSFYVPGAIFPRLERSHPRSHRYKPSPCSPNPASHLILLSTAAPYQENPALISQLSPAPQNAKPTTSSPLSTATKQNQSITSPPKPPPSPPSLSTSQPSCLTPSGATTAVPHITTTILAPVPPPPGPAVRYTISKPCANPAPTTGISSIPATVSPGLATVLAGLNGTPRAIWLIISEIGMMGPGRLGGGVRNVLVAAGRSQDACYIASRNWRLVSRLLLVRVRPRRRLALKHQDNSIQDKHMI